MNNKFHVNNFHDIFQALKIVFENSPQYFFLKLFIVIHSSISPLLSAWLFKEIIDLLTIADDSNRINIMIYVGITASLGIISTLITYFAGKWTVTLNEKIQLIINRKIIYKLSEVPVSFYDDVEAYNRIEAASREVGSLVVILDNFFNLLTALFTIILIIPIITVFDTLTIFIIIVFNIPGVVLQFQIKKNNYETSKDIIHLNRCCNGVKGMLVNEYYAGEVRLFHLFDWLFEKYQNFCFKLTNVKEKNVIKQGKLTLINDICSLMLVILTQINFINKVIAKVITIGEYTMYNTYVSRFNASIKSIISSLMNLYEKELFLHNLFDFLNDNSIVFDSTDSIREESKWSYEGGYKIDFRNVTFSYPKSEIPVLRNLSFTIEAGKTVAIVGLNGAGKSTIVKLILRFYKPNEGKIYLNEQDIDTIPIRDYYNMISIVFQSPRLYPFTLRENIAFGYNLDENIQGRRWINDIITKYPKGLETVILPYLDRTGIEPSRGETQRIALARALSKDSSILIMDEPTSSMDPEIEYAMFKDYKDICIGKTCILISHRLSSVTIADKIILIKNGIIFEEGTHKQLLNLGGEYARLFHMQSEKYIQDK